MSDSSQEQIDRDREILAGRLKETREYLGLSQEDAAKAAGLNRIVISAIETGRRKVESVELSALAKAYRQPIEFFLRSGADEETDEIQNLARAARELMPNDRAELLKFAQYLRTYRAPDK